MEKLRPHCELARVRQLIAADKVRATFRATADAKALGCDFNAMVAIVLALTYRDFYKSMTTYADSTIWQDVYRPTTIFGDLYVKLTVIDEVLIVSFKEL